ncbi:ruBisCO-associated protein-like [Senna tora]|uniref:RuBisCO-associated protein-like n=1 Tax=Senna tora TaxID=362788 RepID=A0A834XLD2_9FABA|nr:ruBisCO-associated protein-like [Senna tora]
MSSTIYREYVSDDSFVQRLQNMSFPFPSEMHIVVCFARDYDANMGKTDGIFRPVFDPSITPQLIASFKQNSPSVVKFYLCIGGRGQTFPFTLINRPVWINNATSSLAGIIQQFKFDGLDVFYPTINTNVVDFVEAVNGLVTNLRTTQRVITQASISTSQNVESPYLQLYRKNPSNFEYVLIGYSILPQDWNIIPYPVITTAVPQILNSGNNTLAHGTSVWAVTNEP